MTKLRFPIAAVLALLSGACSDDDTGATAGGTGASGGSGGVSGSGGGAGAAGSAGAPSCVGTESSDEKLSQAMQVLRDTLAKHDIPGGAIAVVKDGKLVNLGVAGSKRASVCDPITPDTLFRTGLAGSARITAIAALDAVEDGKLSLTAPITDVVPTLSVSNGDASQITLHHALTMSSNYYSDSLATGSHASACVSTLAGAFANATNPILKATPGSMPDEMFLNHELAGLALENADGRPFVDAVTERVLAPLGMGGGFDPATLFSSDHAVGHTFGLEVEVDSDGDCRNRDPSDRYYGSIRDLAKLAEYLTGGAGSILDQLTFDAMLSEQGPNFWSYTYMVYGGIGFRHDELGGDVVGYGSLGQGFAMDFRIYKQRGLAVMTVVNSENIAGDIFGSIWPTVEVIDAVARIYDPSLRPTSEIWTPAYEPDPASLPSLVGTYRDDLGFKGAGARTLEVFLDPTDSGKLAGTLSGSGGTSEPVTFTGDWSADNFALRLGARRYSARFWRDDAGNGSSVQLYSDSGPPFFRVP